MNPNWRLPKEIEEPFREALGHAAKRRVTELHGMLAELSDEQIAGAVSLCGFICAYTAIDVVERKWPSDAGLRRMAQKTVSGENPDEQYGVTEQNVYLFLSQCALGFKPYAEVLDDLADDPHKLLAAPFFFTVNLLATFCPKGKSIWEFLERIESAYEASWALDLNLLPALMVRARMPQPEQNPGGSLG